MGSFQRKGKKVSACKIRIDLFSYNIFHFNEIIASFLEEGKDVLV
jgi:hypothetical protein